MGALDLSVVLFAVGVGIGALRPALRFPGWISRWLSRYLLVAIGLKGGAALAGSEIVASAAASIAVGIGTAFIVPILGFVFLRRVTTELNAAAIAAFQSGRVDAVCLFHPPLLAARQRLGKGKIVVLGLITTKFGAMESKDAIKRRIDEAARYAPIEQLALSPQCGFSSTVHGNDIAVEAQAAKLRLVLDTAREVWADA